MVRVFFVLLIFFAVLAIIPAFRPSYSETEKRELKKFPELKLSSVVSGNILTISIYGMLILFL